MHLQNIPELFCTFSFFLSMPKSLKSQSFIVHSAVMVSRAMQYSIANLSMSNVKFHCIDMSWGIIWALSLKNSQISYQCGRIIVDKFLKANANFCNWEGAWLSYDIVMLCHVYNTPWWALALLATCSYYVQHDAQQPCYPSHPPNPPYFHHFYYLLY